MRDLTEKVRVCENEQNTSTDTQKPVAKSRPKQVSAPSSSSTSTTLPIHLRKWFDVEPGTQNSRSCEVAKERNTLLRHESLPPEEDGAIEFRRLKLEFASNFSTSPHWSTRSWKSHLERSGGHKKRFQYSVDPHVDAILYLRAVREQSGGNPIDPSLQDNVMITNDFLEYIYHVENSHVLQSIISSGLKQEEEMPKGNDRRYSLQSWILWQCIFTSKESSTWPSPELLSTSKSGKCIRMRCTGLTKGLLNERDWRFTRRGQTRWFSTTLSRIAARLCPGTPIYTRLIRNVLLPRAAPRVRIMKFSCVWQDVHFILQFSDLSQKLTHYIWIPFLLHRIFLQIVRSIFSTPIRHTKLILSLWAWSAHWVACRTCNRWDSSSRRDSYRANNGFHLSHSLTSISVSASANFLWDSNSPWIALWARRSRNSWRFCLFFNVSLSWLSLSSPQHRSSNTNSRWIVC